MLRIGVVGAGGWGRNLVRNFAALKDVELVAICDLNEEVRQADSRLYPAAKLFEDFDEMLAGADLVELADKRPG